MVTKAGMRIRMCEKGIPALRSVGTEVHDGNTKGCLEDGVKGNKPD